MNKLRAWKVIVRKKGSYRRTSHYVVARSKRSACLQAKIMAERYDDVTSYAGIAAAIVIEEWE